MHQALPSITRECIKYYEEETIVQQRLAICTQGTHHFFAKDTNTRLYVLRKHALFKKAFQGAQSMLDAGCPALPLPLGALAMSCLCTFRAVSTTLTLSSSITSGRALGFFLIVCVTFQLSGF